MGVIRRLSPSVVNQIAAGEVVERPASVVKELLENAIDAGATRIDLMVERGGKDLVRVADNGVGMAAEDLLLAFQPHATSKLTDVDDLHQIRTLGFRGEALAAIAEISRVRCQSRQAGAEEGSELRIEGGTAGDIKSCGCPPGTVLEVRNLFFNTPVRRTFLKSDVTEAAHVAEVFTRIALAVPSIHLTFRSGGRLVHDLAPAAGMRERIAILFGRELAESLIWVEGRLADIHLWGFVGHPSQSRPNTKGQFLFLNGRFVRDRSLGHALNEAYRGLLMTGRNPIAFLNLTVPPEDVDVNVHPTKIEVRFRDPQAVYSHLLSTIRQTFLTTDLHARLQAVQDQQGGAVSGASGHGFADAANQSTPAVSEPAQGEGGRGAAGDRFGLEPRLPDRQLVASWFQPERSVAPATLPCEVGRIEPPAWSRPLPDQFEIGSADGFDECANPLPSARSAASLGCPEPSISVASAANLSPSEPGRSDLVGSASNSSEVTGDERRSSLGPISNSLNAIQVHDRYLIAETREGMVVIDQHALHERILFEELRQRAAAGNVESQGLLVPEPVHLTAAEAAVVLDHAGTLAELGLVVEAFGGETVLVRSMPVMLSSVAPEPLIRDLAEQLLTRPLAPTREGMIVDILHMIACKAAIKAGQRLSPGEIAALLERRHLVDDSHHCPHGRPTALVFTKQDLEKQFGRI